MMKVTSVKMEKLYTSNIAEIQPHSEPLRIFDSDKLDRIILISQDFYILHSFREKEDLGFLSPKNESLAKT